jgi:sarcosine oxidase subunit gamma
VSAFVADALVISERPGLRLATIMARAGFDSAVTGLDFPSGPHCVARDGLTLVGAGPGVWLAVGEATEDDWPVTLERPLAGQCSVSDQSGAYVVFRISGPAARALLQRGVSIDLHPDVFRPGSAATSVIAHIGVIVWRTGDEPVFDVAVFRSYAAGFRHWIDAQTL